MTLDALGGSRPPIAAASVHPPSVTKAAVFATREEARTAIDELPEAFMRAGIRFSIEPADRDF